MPVGDVLMWFERVASFLTEIVGLWNAIKGGDPADELAAKLELVRAMKRRQTLEDLARP